MSQGHLPEGSPGMTIMHGPSAESSTHIRSFTLYDHLTHLAPLSLFNRGENQGSVKELQISQVH